MTQWTVLIGKKEYIIALDNGKFLLNEKAVNIDIVKIRENVFSVIQENKTYEVEVVEINRAEKKIVLKVNRNEYALEMKNKFDLLLEQMGMSQRAVHIAGSLKAPMPGKVLRVDVNAGQKVKKGDSILILEAMKMENAIKSPGDGKIKSVLVKAGDTVEKGEVLAEME